MITETKIAARIAALMVQGADLRTAFDAVLGAGSYERLAGDVWEAAQVRG
jgi:hypothetical protein